MKYYLIENGQCYQVSQQEIDKLYIQNNLHKFDNARDKAKRLGLIPCWADLDAIKSFYLACPINSIVHHIIPLERDKRITGLHVLNNLEYVSKSKHQYLHSAIKQSAKRNKPFPI